MTEPVSDSSDLEWLDRINCADLNVADFFVDAGHVISDEVLLRCEACPVRRECLSHAYQRNITGGYFGGISPGIRRAESLAQALTRLDNDGKKKKRLK